MLLGFALAVVTYAPASPVNIFKAITHYANPALEHALATAPVTVVADPSECSFQLKMTGTEKFTTSFDTAKPALVAASVNYKNAGEAKGIAAAVKDGDEAIHTSRTDFNQALMAAIARHGYPVKADPGQINQTVTVLLLTILVIFVTMVYGPIAAWLVELFPTRIRYSGLSLPYHIGNGW